MNALEQFAQENYIEGFKEGYKEGFEIGIMEAKQVNINKLAQNLVKQNGNKLSMEEAYNRAKELLTETD